MNVCQDEAIRGRLEVDRLTAEDVPHWDAFVAASPEATFFHLAGWKDVIETAFNHRTHYLIARADGGVEGVLPLAEVRSRLFGHTLVSLPFAVYGGIVAKTERAWRALDFAAQDLAEKLRVGHLEYRGLRSHHHDWPKSEVYVTFRKSISGDPQANMLAIPRKQRAMVRKAIARGLQAEIDESPDRFFELYANNVHRHGTPALPAEYFRLLKAKFGRDCETLIVTHDGGPVSGVLAFYFRDQVLPYYAGDLPLARDLAANDFKYWELMRRSCERGCRVFDFGRSKVGTGSYSFKRNWGFEPTPLHYEQKLITAKKVAENNPLNPKYRLLIAAWRQLPISFANRLGPHIVKHLG